MPIASINSAPAAAPKVIPTGFFVSPTGSASNLGTIGSPWSLLYALSGAGGVIVPGSTIWLRGGTYTQGPTFIMSTSGSVGVGIDDPATKVKWRNFPGEFVSITTTDAGIEVIRVDGNYNWIWGTIGHNEGIEFWRNTLVRNDVRGTNIWFGFTPQTGNKLIHIITRDGSNGVLDGGFNPDYDYGDIELYGCIAYNNGESSSGGTLQTHGFYFRHQGATTKAKVSKCILFNQVGYCLHHWAERALGLRNIESTDNIVWGGGVLGELTGDVVSNILFAGANGAGAPTQSCICSRNYSLQLKQDARSSATLIIGGLSGTLNEEMTVEDNYFVGGGWDQTFASCRVFQFNLGVNPNLKFNRNEFIPLHDSNILENTQAGALTYTSWANNLWHSVSANTNWRQAGTNKTFAAWKAATGLGTTDTADLITRPTVNKVAVIPVTKYNAGYGHVCFYNWEMTPTVNADISTILNIGDSYEVYNVQDIFGLPVKTGVYDGTLLALPTDGRGPPVPVGITPRPPIATNPFFDAFLVKKIS